MSDMTNLRDLARFVGQSDLSAPDMGVRQRAMQALATSFLPRRRSVSDLLGAVLTLSARTRRMVLPRVGIDLDVFSPGGGRAVVVRLPGNGHS
jgi:hypothetical protein